MVHCAIRHLKVNDRLDELRARADDCNDFHNQPLQQGVFRRVQSYHRRFQHFLGMKGAALV
jgi:hypothetical protein